MSNKTLILPVGGKSKRFPNTKPKWLLTHPFGNMMWVESLKQLDLGLVDRVLLVAPRETIDKYGLRSLLVAQFKYAFINKPFEVVELEQTTNSQSQTVFEAIQQTNLSGPVFIKDSDNSFCGKVDFQFNSIAYCDLHTSNIVNPKNKSYLSLNEEQVVSNVVEKQIISTHFCVGGYQFKEAQEFVENYKQIQHLETSSEEVYVSHVIHNMLLNGHSFYGKKVTEFEDWGTIEDWNRYKSTYSTIFLDIDGVLFHNSSQFQTPTWGTSKPLINNLESIKQLRNNNQRCKLILTTARSEEFRDITEQQLKATGLMFDHIVFGLPHAKRILINDFADTNPYPSAVAVNLERNSDSLGLILNGIL